MQRDRARLLDILNAIDKIEKRMAGVSYKNFVENSEKQDAVLYQVIVIGEAANAVSSQLQAKYPEVLWGDIVGMRNVVIHKYDQVDLDPVWKTATSRVADLKEKVRLILEREFGRTG